MLAQASRLCFCFHEKSLTHENSLTIATAQDHSISITITHPGQSQYYHLYSANGFLQLLQYHFLSENRQALHHTI